MKKLITILAFICIISITNAQDNSDIKIEEFVSLQKEAADKEDYQLAAKYQKAINFKKAIKEAATAGDYETASQMKKLLNKLVFDSDTTKENEVGAFGTKDNSQVADEDQGFNHSDPYIAKSKIFKNGFYLDGLAGFGSINLSPSISMGLKMGSKWYFGSSHTYRPGMQLSYFRVDVIPEFSGLTSVNFMPVNVGYASVLNFNDKTGIEINGNIGLGTSFGSDLIIGFHVNPQAKFRYKVLAIGVDYSIILGTSLFNGYASSSNIFSFTFGVKL